MRSGVSFKPWASILLLLTLVGGVLLAQRTYRDVPLPFFRMEMPDPPDADVPAEFYFARLIYSDGFGDRPLQDRPCMIDAPAAERHFLQGLRRLSNVDCRSKEVLISATDDDFFDYPWLYVVEPGWVAAQRRRG